MPNRPRHPSGELRSEVLQIRLTPSERRDIERAAERAGEGVTEYVRRVAVEQAQER